MAELGITMGLPRSGKSSFCKELMQAGYVIICPDKVRLALHGQRSQPLSERFVWASVELMVRALLMQGHKVIVDATHTRHKSRAVWTRMAKDFDIKLDIYWMNTPKEVCLERNVGDGSVPEDVISRMARQLQAPTENEGVVRIVSEATKYA